MSKKAYFYIDDTIWSLRELTRQNPDSMFDLPFFGALKSAYEKNGLKTQLNLFYRTDSFYGYDEFTLADVTDKYKAEWEAASDWLKLAFHAKEEFPDYPHVNATYDDVYRLFKTLSARCSALREKKTISAWRKLSFSLLHGIMNSTKLNSAKFA